MLFTMQASHSIVICLLHRPLIEPIIFRTCKKQLVAGLILFQLSDESAVHVLHSVTFVDNNVAPLRGPEQQYHGFNRTQHIRHQCRKTTVLICHRCIINSGIEKMSYIYIQIRTRPDATKQGILKGEYHCTVDLLFNWFWNQLYENSPFLFLFAKQLVFK